VTKEYIELAQKVAPKTFPSVKTFNASGRGYPDLASLAQFGIPLCTYGTYFSLSPSFVNTHTHTHTQAVAQDQVELVQVHQQLQE